MIETTDNIRRSILEYLGQKLSEINIESRVLNAAEDIGLGTMVITLTGDGKNYDQLVNLTILPRPDDKIEQIHFMQLYFELHETCNDTTIGSVKDLITEINARMPIGHFGINEKKIYCRYVMVLPDSDLPDATSIIETLFLFSDIISVFEKMFEDLAGQRKSLDAIRMEFAF